MINWRDVRSEKALKEFVAAFQALNPYDKNDILAEMTELIMTRRVEEPILRADAPHKPPAVTRGKRQRRTRQR